MPRLGSVVLACAVISCGAGGRQNRLLSTPIGLAKLRGAHEAVFVKSAEGAWRRVWIDTGVIDEWAPAGTLATSADGTVRVLEVDAQYVVFDDERGRRVLSSVPYDPGHRELAMSPDGRWFAFATQGGATVGYAKKPSYDVVVVSTVDLSVHRIDSQTASIHLAWVGADQLWFETLSRWRLIDPATGTVTDPPEIPTSLGIADEDCPAVGLRLQLDDRAKTRDIIAIPIASAANPEQLSTANSRVLISAESDRSHWPHGGPVPHILVAGTFTPSCKYFTFRFGGTIYVGDVADGRFARLTEGDDVSRDPPGQ